MAEESELKKNLVGDGAKEFQSRAGERAETDRLERTSDI